MELNGRGYYLVPSKKVHIHYPLLAVAYVKGDDYSKTIPVDIVELKSEQDVKALVLKKGQYKIFLRNDQGEESSFEINFR